MIKKLILRIKHSLIGYKTRCFIFGKTKTNSKDMKQIEELRSEIESEFTKLISESNKSEINKLKNSIKEKSKLIKKISGNILYQYRARIDFKCLDLHNVETESFIYVDHYSPNFDLKINSVVDILNSEEIDLIKLKIEILLNFELVNEENITKLQVVRIK